MYTAEPGLAHYLHVLRRGPWSIALCRSSADVLPRTYNPAHACGHDAAGGRRATRETAV
ncbi:MAG TPA: hypothetical protein VMS63_02830 [Gaiellaceae bacterium]|nr:hypothetical protein [Gaiellaceae bacterium]